MEVVEKLTTQKAGSKSDWVLSQGAFKRLLGWLGRDSEPGGECYLEMRQRLVRYFDRKNCLSPDELADETLNRVARRLEEEGAIISDAPAHYCYIVARFVLLESWRLRQRQEPLDERLPAHARTGIAARPEASEEEKERGRRGACLERCIRNLDPDDRELILSYYLGEERAKIENRRAIAVKLGVTMNALSIRACRLRDKLEACLGECLSGGG
jgi:DNA-directed RNA polymerase specialized sigma24 family protein